MVLSSNHPLKETMPQTVPSAGYTPPFDYTVFAADSFDLSLLPSPEATLNENELPLSPSTLLYTIPSPPSMFQQQTSPANVQNINSVKNYNIKSPQTIITNSTNSKDELDIYSKQQQSPFSPPYGTTINSSLLQSFKEEPSNNYLPPYYPISPPLSQSSYSNHSSPTYPQSTSPFLLNTATIKTENTIDLEESLEEFKQLQQALNYYHNDSNNNKTQYMAEPNKTEKEVKSSDYQILREVLRDTSFQKKYNLRPFDFGNIVSGFTTDNIKMEEPDENKVNCNLSNIVNESSVKDDVLMETCNEELDREKIEPVLSLAFEQMQKEVNNTSKVLGISTDPTLWNNEDVKAWLSWTTHQFNLPPVQMEYFNMDGQILANLSEEDFSQRAPQGGCVLHGALEIWKAACLETEIAKASMKSPMSNNNNMPSPMTPIPLLTPTSPVPVTINQIQSQSRQNNNQQVSNTPQTTVWNKPNSNQSSTTSSGEVSDEDEEETSPSTPSTAAPNVPPTAVTPTKATTSRGSASGGTHIHLWQFLKELLASPTLYGSAIRWLDRGKGVFKIEDSVRVARLWGKRKNRPAMNYDKLSRSIRQYYKKGIMKKTERSQRLVYQFCHPYCL